MVGEEGESVGSLIISGLVEVVEEAKVTGEVKVTGLGEVKEAEEVKVSEKVEMGLPGTEAILKLELETRDLAETMSVVSGSVCDMETDVTMVPICLLPALNIPLSRVLVLCSLGP